MERKIRQIQPSIRHLPSRKRVAAYARVSTEKEAMLKSLSAQVSYYSDYIQRHPGWAYMGVYTDEAQSGTKDTRKAFQRMLTDCRAGKIDMIITKSISRFARNTVTLLEVVRELKSLNVDVFFEKENIHSISGDGELMLTILASFAQAESLSVSENCKWRIRKQFQEGELATLRFMYGYDVDKGKVKINPEQAEIVRSIFHDYLKGLGCNLIARKLQEQGVKSHHGGAWTRKRIVDILKNEKYTGNALLQKRYVANHLTKAQVNNHGVLPKYYAEGTHAPIIDNETFLMAQTLMETNRIKNNIAKRAKIPYPFSSKILCLGCGKHYKRTTTKGRISWKCSTYFYTGKDHCHAKAIPEDILLKLTQEVLGLTAFDEAILNEKVKQIQIPAHHQVIFVLCNGSSVEKTWQDRSRKDSWDDEARQQARERQITLIERRNPK